MNLFSLMKELEEKVEEYLSATMKEIKPSQAGLDPRAGYALYVGDDWLAVKKYNEKALLYYGGFEYVKKEYRYELGNYVFYSANDDRVGNAIDTYMDSE